MGNCFQGCWILAALLLLARSEAYLKSENRIKSSVFLSPKFVMGPGSVAGKFYFDIDFPRGHIAIKSFDAEVVDEAGVPVPLHETYLHHWLVEKYHVRKGAQLLHSDGNRVFRATDYTIVRNSGICKAQAHYFGLGSETRKTLTNVPDPYGIEIGNPNQIPAGYEEIWMLNIHAIDTRGVEDKLGCTECRCNLYNVTVDENGRPLKPDYKGGLSCCYDQTQCRLRHGYEGARRSLYLKYTITWVDWDSSIIPVKIYIFDVTDTWKRPNGSLGLTSEHHCLIEYDVEPCSSADDACIHTQRATTDFPTGGYLIYGVAHQHSGGVGSTLYGEDGRALCTSIPTYGDGKEAGNEADYIVGMSTCYPEPGSIKITDGEILTQESNYSSTRDQRGVMGLFYILVADRVPEPKSSLHHAVNTYRNVNRFVAAVAVAGVVAVAVVAVVYQRRNKMEGGYQPIMISLI